MLDRMMSPGHSVSPEQRSELKRSAAIDHSQIWSSSKRHIPASPRYTNGFSASTRSVIATIWKIDQLFPTQLRCYPQMYPFVRRIIIRPAIVLHPGRHSKARDTSQSLVQGVRGVVVERHA